MTNCPRRPGMYHKYPSTKAVILLFNPRMGVWYVVSNHRGRYKFVEEVRSTEVRWYLFDMLKECTELQNGNYLEYSISDLDIQKIVKEAVFDPWHPEFLEECVHWTRYSIEYTSPLFRRLKDILILYL